MIYCQSEQMILILSKKIFEKNTNAQKNACSDDFFYRKKIDYIYSNKIYQTGQMLCKIEYKIQGQKWSLDQLNPLFWK